jgi:hypothetical protein
MNRMRPAVFGLAAALATAGPAAAQEPADRAVVNAVIHTMDPAAPRAEALAALGGRIVAVGTEAEVRLHVGPTTDVVDAGGRTVIPGLIDAHGHVMGLGRSLRILDLVGTTSPEEIAMKVRAAAADRAPGEWILGRGWDQNDWAVKEFPTHAELDAAGGDHPVWLTRVDGHAGWANARAMVEAGVTADTPDPDGGRMVRDAAGRPTGVFVDNAEALIEAAIPDPGPEERWAWLAAAQQHLLSVGLTGVHDMGVGPETVELYREWVREGRLGPRVVAYLSDGPAVEWWRDEGRDEADPSDRFRVAGVKLYADGALGSRGAALLDDYSDDPGNRGLLVTPPDTLRAHVARAVELGLQPAIHAIGDRGNREALDAIAAAPAGGALPPRIEHAQVVALEDLPRFARQGVLASMQPTHATSDMYWAEDRVGPERIEGAYAWRTLRDSGAALACGSDFPVERANPFHGLHAAVARQDAEGWPEGGWRPTERMTREEALACFTRDAAAAAGMADEVGTLKPGLRADFLILDADPLAVPESEIRDVRVYLTVIDGVIMHAAAQ